MSNGNTPSYYSSGSVCESMQVSPSELSALTWEASVRPAYRVDGIDYYDDEAMSRLYRLQRGELRSRTEKQRDPRPSTPHPSYIRELLMHGMREQRRRAERDPDSREVAGDNAGGEQEGDE